MESVIIKEFVSALGEGNFAKGLGYLAIFFVIWLEVRGLKKEVAKVNGTIAKSFAEGETRFTQIEHRLTVIEENQPTGGENGRSLRPEGIGSNH